MLTTIKVAIIATSHASMGDTGEATGVWLEELTTPYYAFVDAGVQVTVFSIKGGEIPIDPRSLQPAGKNEASVERFLKDKHAAELFANTKAVTSIDLSDYDAVFLPGGHGTMWDYPDSDTLAKLVAGALEDNKVVGAVCHGPAGLVNATFSDGTSVVAGKQVAGFTNSEEDAVGLTEAVPFLLETRLRELGANYQSGADFQPFAVRDGNLVTGQNPASAGLTVKHMLDALKDAR
ncbi:MAG: type 1 glutamine amidotransferase domain-containing protein [Pseudomonadota bacterium]